ncbi:MAG: DUF6802 family protein [Rhodococcus sp. (in: high G+C Gram-positive bacteria)]
MAEWSGGFDQPLFGDDPDADFVPDVDLDGDGFLDTVMHTGASPDGGLIVLTDLDGDGRVDRVTEIDGDGDYTAWVSTSHQGEREWLPTDRGSL